MAQRLLLIRYESGHVLRAVPAGGDPYTEGTTLTDHADGFYSATLPVNVYDIYYKDEPDDPTWIQLSHYQGRFHPTDDITDNISGLEDDVTSLDSRVSVLEGDSPVTPANVESIRSAEGVHIQWGLQEPGTIYIVRGIHHHSDESVNVNENSRILYAGYTPECLLNNSLRFADIESRPFDDIELDFKVWAQTAAGTSNPTDTQSIALDLTSERLAFCGSAALSCESGGTSADKTAFISVNYPGTFPKTTVNEQNQPTSEPARILSFHRDVRVLRIEAESLSEASENCNIYICDSFSGEVYPLEFEEGERFARSEETGSGNPSIMVMRYPDSKLLIYSDDATSLQDVEVRLTLGIV